MISFPGTTTVGRVMPKEAFYKRLTLSNELKAKFIGDIQRITLLNSLTAATLRLEPGVTITEILLLAVDLKKQAFDPRIMESIARQNSHKLVFLLRCKEQGLLALLYHNKLYCTPWRPLDKLTLEANGFTLDAVWDGFLEQIALAEKEYAPRAGLSVEERIKRQEAVEKLQAEIKKTEELARAEIQPKKKFELFQQVQELKRELERLYGE